MPHITKEEIQSAIEDLECGLKSKNPKLYIETALYNLKKMLEKVE